MTEYTIKMKQQSIDEYNKNPKLCRQCGKIIPLNGRKVAIVKRNKFCSKVCVDNYSRTGISIEKVKQCKIKHRKKRREIIYSVCGKDCYFCGSIKSGTIHRKDGNSHPSLETMTIDEIINLNNNNEYIRVCRWCHKGIHWSMKNLNLNWINIEKMFKQAPFA